MARSAQRCILRFTAAVTAAVLIGGVVAADDEKKLVNDPYYGEALFHFYQQDHFTALTHLLAASKAGRLQQDANEADLLLGGLYLSYGQHHKASGIFERLLAEGREASVRSRAWFYLGKVRYRRGLYDEALDAFARATTDLDEPLDAERHMLTAQSHLANADYAAASRVLDSWSGPEHWMAFARYNLGVALVRLDQFEQGAGYLDAVGRLETNKPELVSLRDKANVALGFTWLQKDQPEAARAVLQRVRLNGPFSGKALLGVGWADVARDEYRAALTPWLELSQRDLLDSAVQESLLAIPYALQRLEAHGSAVEHYQSALTTFGAEVARLDAAIERARSGELIPALLQIDDPDVAHWYWQLDNIPDTADSRYLFHLIADHRFHEGLRNSRDLLALTAYLDDWLAKLATFRDMVDTKGEAYEQRMPVVQARMQQIDIPALQARRDAMKSRLASVEARRDVIAMASATEMDAWQRLTALEKNPAWMHEDAADLRHEQRVLKGLLLWDADRDYKLRIWQQHRSLEKIDAALAKAQLLRKGTEFAQLADPGTRDAYRSRIDQLDRRIRGLQAQVEATLAAQDHSLGLLAAAELEARKQRLSTYQLQARFALATVLDRATAARATSGKRP